MSINDQPVRDTDDAVREVAWAWEQFKLATGPIDYTNAVIRLSNAISDLQTWHPDYDNNMGEILDTDTV